MNLFQAELKKIDVDGVDDELVYQMTASQDSWTHARRKRRLEMSSESASKKARVEGEQVSESTETSKQEPFLVCNMIVQAIEEEQKVLRISMIFCSGRGGKSALENLRQWLVNKLNVREYFLQKNALNRKEKRRKNQ